MYCIVNVIFNVDEFHNMFYHNVSSLEHNSQFKMHVYIYWNSKYGHYGDAQLGQVS